MRRFWFVISVFIGLSSFGQSFEYYDSLDIRGVEFDNRIDGTGWKSLWEVKRLIKEGALSKAQEDILLEFNDNDLVAFQHNLRGELALRYSNYDEAQNQFETALSMTSDKKLRALILSNLGLYYLAISNQSKAIDYLEKALRQKKRVYGGNALHVGAAYNNLGLAYTQSESKTAIEYFKNAGRIYEAELTEQNYYKGIKNTNLALAFQNARELDSALTYAKQALSANISQFGADHPTTIFSKTLVGQIHLANHNYEFADLFLEESIEQLTQLYGQHHGELASVYNALAVSKTEQLQFEQAEEVLNKAHSSNNSRGEEEVLVGHSSIIEHYYNQDAVIQTFYERGVLFEQLYHKRYLRRKDLEKSIKYYQIAVVLIDELRHHRVSAADKLKLAAISKQVYTQALGVCYELNSTSLKRDAYLKEAFFFIEKSKASVLQEAIADSKAKSFAGLPDSLLQIEKDYKSVIAFLSKKVVSSTLTEAEENTLFESKVALDQLIRAIEKDYPDYHRLKYASEELTLDAVQECLKEGELLLDYFIGNNGYLYRLEVTKSKTRIQRTIKPNKFANRVKGFRNAITYKAEGAFLKTGKELGDLLLPKSVDQYKELVILSDGELGMIPFAALLTSKKGEQYSEYDYLIKKVSLRYHLSGNLFVESRKIEQNGSMTVGVFTPVEYSSFGLKTLNGAEREQEAISPFLSSYDVKKYLRSEATESLFIRECGNYSLLHLPTHGVVDQKNPSLSRIYLTPDAQEDGVLYVGEVYGISLKANLITLSACETGLGKLAKGEGVIGLSRALVYAGAKNIVVSFWTVNDEATASLMTSFYKNRQQLDGVALPLRNAQLDLINSSGFSAPYYWASFFQIGGE